MTRVEIRWSGDRIFIRGDAGSNLDEWRTAGDDDIRSFEEWIANYRRILGTGSKPGELLALGRDIYRWLNGNEKWIEKLIDPGIKPPLIVEYTVENPASDKDLVFLEVPWELLTDGANKGKYLAADAFIKYTPIRRFGRRTDRRAPSEYRLNTVFMAAEPRGGMARLSYEAEEAAILQAAGNISMDLTVEESGALDRLAEVMAREAPVDVLHISCHGTNVVETKLMLETDEGDPAPVTAFQLDEKLGPNKPNLLFLSACKTAEPTGFLSSMSAALIRLGTPAVLGWGGAVGDAEATRFAALLYQNLSQRDEIETAVARARLRLLNPEKSEPESRDWHLARLYLGPAGGGELTQSHMARRPVDAERGHKEFLGAKEDGVPVAGRYEFVGRRQQVQEILREFRRPANQCAGVLIHGFGRQGKSSLAARVAGRLPDHQLVLVYKYYEAHDILAAFNQYAGTEEVRVIAARHIEGIRENPAHLSIALRELLEKPCRGVRKNQAGDILRRPVLLVIDDFEQALADPVNGGLHTVQTELTDSIRAVIEAFERAETDSRLLVTSRYHFTLHHQGRNWAECLHQLHLAPMETYEGRKQARAKEKGRTLNPADPARTERCVNAAQGNPGLQNLLFLMSLTDPEECDRTLADLEAYIQSGRAPNQKKLLEFLQNLTIDRLITLLTENEKKLFEASTLFNIPVPTASLDHLARYAGFGPSARLFALGLWESFPDLVDPAAEAALVNALVRPRAGRLNKEKQAELAEAVLPDLFQRWGGPDGSNRPYVADLELTRLALAARNTDVLTAAAVDAVRGLEKRFEYRFAAGLGKDAVACLDKAEAAVPPDLLRITGERCHRVGDMAPARALMARAVEAYEATLKDGQPVDEESFAAALISHARVLVQDGSPEQALSFFERAKGLLQSEQYKRSRAVTLGDIARIKVDRGEVAEALELHQEELKVYEDLGDQVGIAAALFDMAGIELGRGATEKAFEYLIKSYATVLKSGRLDGICHVGLLLGRILCHRDQKEKGLEILARSRDGFRKLGWEDLAEESQKLMDSFS